MCVFVCAYPSAHVFGYCTPNQCVLINILVLVVLNLVFIITVCVQQKCIHIYINLQPCIQWCSLCNIMSRVNNEQMITWKLLWLNWYIVITIRCVITMLLICIKNIHFDLHKCTFFTLMSRSCCINIYVFLCPQWGVLGYIIIWQPINRWDIQQ